MMSAGCRRSLVLVLGLLLGVLVTGGGLPLARPASGFDDPGPGGPRVTGLDPGSGGVSLNGPATIPAILLPPPPVAERRPHRSVVHGQERWDDWHWLRERDNPNVIAYLEAENRYTDEVMRPYASLTERIFAEIRGRIDEEDVSVPERYGEYYYYSRDVKGREYKVRCRKHGGASAPEEIMFDENELASGQPHFVLGAWRVSPDHRLVAFITDTTGAESYTLQVKDLTTGRMLPDRIPDVSCSDNLQAMEWGNDNRTLFYVKPSATRRPYQAMRHVLGTTASADVLLYQEDDGEYVVEVGKTRDDRYVTFESACTTTSEVRLIDADRPLGSPTMLIPRRKGVDYTVYHHGPCFYLLTNEAAPDFKAVVMPETATDSAHWREFIPHRPGTRLERLDFFARQLVAWERSEATRRLRVLDLPVTGLASGAAASGSAPVVGPVALRETGVSRRHPWRQRGTSDIVSVGAGATDASGTRRSPAAAVPDVAPPASAWREVAFDQPVYAIFEGRNEDFFSKTLRVHFQSLATPNSVYDLDLETGRLELRRRKRIPGGFDPAAYQTERLWAIASDGVRVPISIVYRRDFTRDGTRPLFLYGYGAYGSCIDPDFSIDRISLLDRGFAWAIAHIRGGEEMGRSWYLDGKLQHKRNSFADFITCAEHLVREGYAARDRIAINGVSAGGLLMGAVATMRPDLWRVVIAEVPFVDVVNTQLDPTIPLVVEEYEEWGNPTANRADYEYLRSYSPYDNITARDYPAMWVTGGLNDPRVQYWEPAKFVAKLRATKTDRNPLLLKTNMDSGHFSVSGRYAYWREVAQQYAFILAVLGSTH